LDNARPLHASGSGVPDEQLLSINASTASADSISFIVDINTTALEGSPSGSPFSVDFQLNGGNPTSNTATISDFTFGGGSPNSTPGPTTNGSATGDLGSTVTLTDSSGSFFNEFYQGFNAGSTLDFNVTLTDNAPANSPPDEFAVAILDDNLNNIPTTDPFDSIVDLSLSGPSTGIGDVQTFAATGAFAGVRAAIIPEPGTLVLVAIGLGALGRTARGAAGRAANGRTLRPPAIA